MKNIPNKIRKLMVKCGNLFMRINGWNRPKPWHDKGYYISFDGFVIDMKPYYGWKRAYRAAKAKHSHAFIISGRTLNRNLERARIASKGDMRTWNYGAAS